MASISHQWCELEASANDHQWRIKPAAAERGGVLTCLLCRDDEGAGLSALFSSQTFLKSPVCFLKYTLNNGIIVLAANKCIN